MNNFANTKGHGRTCSQYLLEKKKFLIVAHWLVKCINRIFSGFGFHFCVASRIRIRIGIPSSCIRIGVGVEKTWVRTPLLSGCAMLHFKGQVSPPCVEVDLRLCFHWGVSRAQYIDTLSWFNVVFAYRDHGSGPHTVTLSLFQIPVKWLKFSRFKSKPKTILQNIMQMRKLNLVQIQIPVTVIGLTPADDVTKSHITLNS